MNKSLVLLLLLAGSSLLPAQSFFTATPQYLTPAWRGSPGAEFSHWDVFYTPFGEANLPDKAAPHGLRQLASVAGATVPANADPTDPFAFWNPANPTLTQGLQPGAFIIGAGTAGNIYSFSGATGFEVADTTPSAAGTVVFQWQTDGTLIDTATLKLVADGIEYAPTNFITEYKASGAAFGGVTNRSAAQWDLTGLGITSYKVTFQSEGSSCSFQEAQLDTAPTYAEAVPSARTWTALSGVWSDAGNWSPSSLPPTGGNVTVASTGGLTVDGGVREIGELQVSAPGVSTFGASGGGVLKINSGITATPAAPASYVLDAPVTIGAYHLTFLNANAELICNGVLSGNAGFYLLGAGRMKVNASPTFSGAVTVDGATLEISAGVAFSGAGTLTVLPDSTLSGAGTIGRATAMQGIHAPGPGVATLTHTATLAYAATAHLSWQLGSSTTGAGAFDKVAAAAVTVAAGAKLDLTFDAPGGTVDFRDLFWQSARSWPVLTSTTRTGTFTLGTISGDALGNVPANYGTFALTHAATGVTLVWTPFAPWESWRRVSFGADWNNAAVSGELVDVDADGLRNVVEYALAGTGSAFTPPPQIGTAEDRLALSFTRNAAASDVTITIRGADSPDGPWTDLAQSVHGSPTAALLGGVAVIETGTGPTRAVEVRDLYLTTDPAHPQRFLQIHVQR